MALQESLVAEITRTVREHPANRHPGTEEPFFDAPLVGFAAADDPLFRRYKELIGPFHWTPAEVFEAVHESGAAGAQTVVCWILPITESTRRSNKQEDRLPSRPWARTRNFGEQFNEDLRRGVVAFLEQQGARAVAPVLRPDWKPVTDPTVGIASTWSERHAAYAAGLGTFSLNDGLITARGIAHRIGTVVTDAVLPTAAAPQEDYRRNCAFFAPKGCGVCIGRCPAGAISEHGHDKSLCKQYSYGAVLDAVAEKYGVAIAGCGLCQTKVPCENRIPPAARDR